MKIRNGFVSNSSSSSFVVAFPEKPKDEDEVLKVVFGEDAKEYGHLVAYDDVAHYGDISVTIYGDIGKDSATVEEMVEIVSCKYSYLKEREIEYSDKYFCSDKEKARELVDLGVKKELLYSERSKDEDAIMRKNGLVARCFENREQYDKEGEKRCKVRDSDEFQLVESEFFDKSSAMYGEMDAISHECAKADVELFIKDNEDSFFAVFNYGDDSGSYFAVIEHGETFKRLPHIRVSQH